MKKLFFYAAAALAMFASCKKAEINEPQPTPVDDNTPVAMQFNVNAPSFEITKTKAAVEAWNNTEIQVIGLINEGDATTPQYDFGEKVFDKSATVTSSTENIELYQDEDNTVPYFYAEGKLYDFYAYYLGGASAEAQDETVANTITIPVEITGSEDLMVAQPNKSQDIKADTSTDGVTVADVYSAWAARRGVHPTLVFEHALTRFNFIVRGMDEPAETVTIKGIKMTDLSNTGTLTVVGTDLGYEADATVTDAELELKNADDSPYTKETVTIGNTIAAGNGSCLMVQPGLKNINVEVEMEHTYNSQVITLDPYTFTVNASQVLKEGVAAGISTFAAGTAYNIYINVYGPQEIKIKAELTDWADGGDYTYDPDQRPGAAATSVTADRTVEDGVITYSITYSSDITALQGVIATGTPEDADYKTLVDTRGFTGISYELQDGENAENFKLYVRYQTTETTDNKSWTTIDDVQPAFAITNSYVVVNTEESWNQLPEAYRNGGHAWGADLTAAPQNADLPWIAAEFTPGATVTPVAEIGDFSYDMGECTSTVGLVTFGAKEMGLPFLTAGEWTITLNGLRTKVEVEHDITAAYLVEDSEKSYNQLPEAYRTAKGDYETYLATAQEDKLPWLAVEVTPGIEVEYKVYNPENALVRTFTKTTAKIGLITVAASELNEVESLTAGTWTVVVNNIPTYITVK